MKKQIKRYGLFLVMVGIYGLFWFFIPNLGKQAVALTGKNLVEMITILPPIFILIGLLDVWIKKEVMVKYMGEGSGWKGILLAFFLGAAAAGPLYAAFPVAILLMKKGSKLSNVYIMLGTWSTAKIPLVLFEASTLGLSFTLVRLLMSLVAISSIAFIIHRTLTPEEKAKMYAKAERLS